MRGLRLHLTPFAPDQSGAVSALFELGGIVVVADAGGCTGNICGFDEPRWHTMRSAVFSAGLRDMDAIMGRDDKLVAGVASAASVIDARFVAIVGTPVPAVIGTDMRALCRMSERASGLPTIACDCNGTELYDAGARKAWLALFRRFAKEPQEREPGRVGILGASPLELSEASAATLRALVPGGVTYGMGSDLDELVRAAASERNLVVSPAALPAARLLERRFSIPFEVTDPRARPLADQIGEANDVAGKRVLVVSQQVSANALRDELLTRGAAGVTCATWFEQVPELAQPQDVRLAEEDDLAELARSRPFDVLVGDATLFPLVRSSIATLVDVPEFAVSGRLRKDWHA